MEQRYMQAWQTAILKMQDEVSPFVFDAWYRDLMPIDFVNNQYVVEVNNDTMLLGLTQQGFGDSLLRWVKMALGDDKAEIQFLNSEDAALFRTRMAALKENTASHGTPANDSIFDNMACSLNTAPRLEVLDGHRLQPNYTFETFVIGKNNEQCRALCKAIADDMSRDLNCNKSINPLFIYGNSGLGKTHLLNAIAFQILQAQPEAKIKFTTCENFVNEYIASINPNQNSAPAFRSKYRNVDVLLIDDIQFLTGKEGTQEEFFHTFEELRNNNRQIIITSDKLPREIPDLEERLVTRFEGGVLSNIQVPNVETRIAILQKKAEMENAVVDNRIIEYIVDNVAVNIRTLEGALQTVISTARISNQPITLELAERTIKNKVAHEKHLTQDIIITKVCEYYGLSREKMMGTSRKKDVLLPRQVSMYFCRSLLAMSLPAIGKLFRKDHSTVSNAIDKIEEGMQQDPLLQSDIHNIRRAIES
ncbi:MAG: chromosomal replication initiator protein DnaA [Peptococcaceae bacterium]|nr:chromosomal replication initiator protein DnaA [Peptococcaceae bacterium]